MLTIISLAVGLAIILYQYSTISSDQIQNLADEESRIEAKTQSNYLASELTSKISSVSSNLDIIVHARSVKLQDVQEATQLLESAENSTSDITSAYAWLDKDGKILWATSDEKLIGLDFSFRDYYLKPKETLTPYYSTPIQPVNGGTYQSSNGTLLLTISYPIFSQNNQHIFNGVMIAVIPISKIGQFAKSQLVQGYNSSIGIMSRNGLILYSGDSTKFVGKKISDPEIQSLLPSDVKDQFNAFIKNSLEGKNGTVDFTSQGKSSTIAYDPVKISGVDFVLLYVTKPHTLATSTLALVEQPRTLSLISIIIIGTITSLVVVILFTLNKRLQVLVDDKTRNLIEANNQLIKLNESQREFINIAAHELKTPIQPIIAISEEFEPEIQKNEEYVKISHNEAEIILRNARRLSRITGTILTVSKIENKLLFLNKEKVNLREKILETIEDVKKFIKKDPAPDIIFNPKLSNEIFVDADKTMLFEVLSNLLINAIKFTKHGSIIINLAKQERYAIVSIRDTGEGIASEISQKIFDKFVTKSGTGLGLFITKNLVELHGGKIWFEKNENGVGTTFSFSLPLGNPEN